MRTASSAGPPTGSLEMSLTGRYLVLSTAFLGWMFAGMLMGMFPLIARSATIDFLGAVSEGLVGKWFAWYTCAFLMGAATGGPVFGWIGDRAGRVHAMALSIVWYSALTGVSYLSETTEQLLVLRFLASMGIGGMWPNGVSLVSEAWSDVSRPVLAGLIGSAANVGFVLIGVIGERWPITSNDWRWVMLVGGLPIFLGLFVWAFVPESPAWLAERTSGSQTGKRMPVAEVFRPPLLRLTLIGICLGAVPLVGGWGASAWLVPWADQVYGKADPAFKGLTVISRSGGAVLGSLIGGLLASLLGRRTTYFLISLGSLLASGYLFRFLTPADGTLFLIGAFLLGFVGTVYFGWLPLYLPELFPTHARATGSGVTFNFGRIISAAGVLAAGALIRHYDGDYAKVGSVTSLAYALGMLVILFAPDTSKKQLHGDAGPTQT